MSYSLNEVEAIAKKATRGAGYSWGIAEDAARSVIWLCCQSADGCAILARHLESIDDSSKQLCAPSIGGSGWGAENGCLCPLSTGAAMSDRAAAIQHEGLSLAWVSEPALLLYFAAIVAQRRRLLQHPDFLVQVKWAGCRVVTDGESMSMTGAFNEFADRLKIDFCRSMGLSLAQSDRARPDNFAWQTLTRFASRTYAPATEESRLKGAGAGFSDND